MLLALTHAFSYIVCSKNKRKADYAKNHAGIMGLTLISHLSRTPEYIKQLHTKSYIITKGALQFRGGGNAIHVAPEVDVVTDCDALRTAEATEKERVVTMSTASVAEGAL